MTQLDSVMAQVRAENRAALIAYIPAGFPSQAGCAKAIQALADAGVDAIEIGFPYSDPVMDGPVIQEAADISLKAGTNAADVFAALKVAASTGVAAVVMTYWIPIAKNLVALLDHLVVLIGLLAEPFAIPKALIAVIVVLIDQALPKNQTWFWRPYFPQNYLDLPLNKLRSDNRCFEPIGFSG
jgi:hypothetical protein